MAHLLAIILFITPFPLWARHGGNPNEWELAATKACSYLEKTVRYYHEGESAKARETALVTYFEIYDAALEPSVRSAFGPLYTFKRENQFRSFNESLKKPSSKRQEALIKEQAKNLCEAMKEDAKNLKKKPPSLRRKTS